MAIDIKKLSEGVHATAVEGANVFILLLNAWLIYGFTTGISEAWSDIGASRFTPFKYLSALLWIIAGTLVVKERRTKIEEIGMYVIIGVATLIEIGLIIFVWMAPPLINNVPGTEERAFILKVLNMGHAIVGVLVEGVLGILYAMTKSLPPAPAVVSTTSTTPRPTPTAPSAPVTPPSTPTAPATPPSSPSAPTAPTAPPVAPTAPATPPVTPPTTPIAPTGGGVGTPVPPTAPTTPP